MGQVQKERAVFISFYDFDRFFGVIVGQIASRFEPWSTIEAGGKAHGSPQKAIDGIEVLASLDDIFIIVSSVKSARHEQAFCETLVVGGHAFGLAKVPFTDMNGVIALVCQQFRNGDFRSGHSHIFKGCGISFCIGKRFRGQRTVDSTRNETEEL